MSNEPIKQSEPEKHEGHCFHCGVKFDSYPNEKIKTVERQLIECFINLSRDESVQMFELKSLYYDIKKYLQGQ